jgi:predicted N-acyltransferase
LRKYPLLICRSPFSNTSGLIAPDGETLASLVAAAVQQARQAGCLALLLDFLDRTEVENMPEGLYIGNAPSPGTVLVNTWDSFDQYLSRGNKKDRQHYKRVVRKADELGIQVRKKSYAHDVDTLASLVNATEQKHGSEPNPWTKGILSNMEMAGGNLLLATRNGELTGCGLLFEENGAQLATALGHSLSNDYTYFLLAYTGIEIALTQGVRTLRWGSGAYEVKRRLGFVPEDNAGYAFIFTHPLVSKIELGIKGLCKWTH